MDNRKNLSATSRNQNRKPRNLNTTKLRSALVQELNALRSASRKRSGQGRKRGNNLAPSAVRAIRDANVATSASVAYSRGFSQANPIVERVAGSDSVRIRKRELVASIATPSSGASAFSVASTLALNPGLPGSFPWLSTQAGGWEQYKFNRLRFDYYTRTATTTVGSVMLVPDYDASDSAPTSESQAMDYKDAKEEAPWVVEFCCDLTPSALHPGGVPKYIRQGAVANTDIKTYDAGTMYVCTVDAASVSANWGKLFVEYDVVLSVSQLPTLAFGSAVGTSTTATTTAALAGMTYLTQINGLTLIGTGNSLNVNGTIPGFEYVLSWGSTAATAVLTVSSVTSGTIKSNYSGGTGSAVATITANSSSFQATLAATVANPATSLISIAAIPTAPQ